MPIHQRYQDGQVVESVEEPASAADVKAEAQRRIMALVGAATMEACLIKQLNASMRAIELSDARQARALTTAEEAEASALRSMAAAIKAIRAASDMIEQSPPIEVSTDPRWEA